MLVFLVACAAQKTTEETVPAPAPIVEENVPPTEPEAPAVPAEPQQKPSSEIQTQDSEPQAPNFKPPAPGPSSLGTRILKAGIFDGKKVSGRVSLIKKTDGSRVIALESFYAEPAANLHVFLVENVAADGIDIERLVSKQGAQQYNVPSDLNAARINQVAIYNPEKDIVWGAAVLS